MKRIRYLLLCLLLAGKILFVISCNNPASTPEQDHDVTNKVDSQIPKTSTNSELKVGGIYLSKNENGSYSVSKILAMDNFAIHLRIYSDTFKTKPSNINTPNLNIAIGHAPLDKGGFLNTRELLKVEVVNHSELDGYRLTKKL